MRELRASGHSGARLLSTAFCEHTVERVEVLVEVEYCKRTRRDEKSEGHDTYDTYNGVTYC